MSRSFLLSKKDSPKWGRQNTSMEKKPLPRRVLARNLRHLMRLQGISETELAKKAKISQKSVNNIVNEVHSPKLDIVESLAAVFGLNAWHLIMPNLPEDLILSPTISKLFDSYTKATPEGRQLIDMIAEREGKLQNP